MLCCYDVIMWISIAQCQPFQKRIFLVPIKDHIENASVKVQYICHGILSNGLCSILRVDFVRLSIAQAMGEHLSAGRVSLDGVLLVNKISEYVFKMRQYCIIIRYQAQTAIQIRNCTKNCRLTLKAFLPCVSFLPPILFRAIPQH